MIPKLLFRVYSHDGQKNAPIFVHREKTGQQKTAGQVFSCTAALGSA